MEEVTVFDSFTGFGDPTPHTGHLAQPEYRRRCLVLQLDIPCFVDINGRPALS